MGQDGKKLKPPVIGAFRYGTMTGAEFAPSKHEHPDVKLVGDWEGEGLGYWYANWKTVTALARAGLLQQMPGDGKKFQAVTGHRFCVWRVQGQGDAHDWFAVPYDAQSQTMRLNPFTDPVEPQDAAQAAPAPPGQPGAPVGPQQQPPPQREGPASGNPPPTPTNHSTEKQRAEDKAKRQRQTLAKVDALYGLALVVAAYQQVRFFKVPVRDLDVDSLQAGGATVMIALERVGYDPENDRRPAYLKRLRRLEHQLFPDRCPDPDADVKSAEKEKPKRKSRAGPPKERPEPAERPEPEPAPVSTIPGAQSLAPGQSLVDFPEALDNEDDDLPF